jgi:exonuclease SbcC
MRPLELRLRNFRSYFGSETVFDFRERRLVGIVGPIGSGKSSILDAIAFALYGKTPSVGRGTKALIHQRADDAAVAFRFEVEGEVWEAQRMLRRKGQSQHALYRLEDDTPNAEKTDSVVQEGDVNATIAALLGLDFDAFGRSVMLAQGRFAEFLTAQPRERDKVLKGVFGYDRVDRMRETAKEIRDVADIDAQKASVKVAHLEDLERENASRGVEHDQVVERLGVLEKARPDVEQIDRDEQEAMARRDAAAKRIGELDDIGERLPEQSRATDLVDEAVEAAERRAKVSAALEAAQLQSVETAEAFETLESKGEGHAIEKSAQALAVRTGHVEAQGEAQVRREGAQARLAEAEEALTDGRDRVEPAELARTAAAEAFDDADRAWHAADEEYHQAAHRDMAVTLKAGLKVGVVCPVCERSVADLPAAVVAPDLERARTILADARKRRTAAEQRRTEAGAAFEAARTSLAAAASRRDEAGRDAAEADDALETADARVRAVDERLEKLLGGEDPVRELTRRREGFAAAGRAAGDASRALERARDDHDAVVVAEREIGNRLDALRVQIADVGGRLGVETPSRDSVADSLAEMHQHWLDAGSAVRRDAADAEAVITSLGEQRRELLQRLDIEGSFAEVHASIRAEAKLLSEEIDRTDRKLAGAAIAIAEYDRLVARRDVFAQLGSDLTDAKFVRFLLDDERFRLAALGSVHFLRLTNGRYQFSDDGVFDVVDLTSADSVRKAVSLSGGETFLASLALALALAEMVSRSGGRLDAFFLDEGFGTLDPEHLDLAMEGVETLVAEDASRLVVVVSHVAELRHRVEDLIELERDPVTGDTMVLRS